MNFRLPGTCLNPTDEDRWISERIAALERASRDTDTLWVDPQHRDAIVLLQDHAQHIGEAVDGCQRSLTTITLLCFLAILHLKVLSRCSMLLDGVNEFII
jgi:hypothetical protein